MYLPACEGFFARRQLWIFKWKEGSRLFQSSAGLGSEELCKMPLIPLVLWFCYCQLFQGLPLAVCPQRMELSKNVSLGSPGSDVNMRLPAFSWQHLQSLCETFFDGSVGRSVRIGFNQGPLSGNGFVYGWWKIAWKIFKAFCCREVWDNVISNGVRSEAG